MEHFVYLLSLQPEHEEISRSAENITSLEFLSSVFGKFRYFSINELNISSETHHAD